MFILRNKWFWRFQVAQEWLSIVEYARAFDVSDMTIRRRIKTGKLQAVLKEGKYYIPVEGASAEPTMNNQHSQMTQQQSNPHLGGSHLNSQYMANQMPGQNFARPTAQTNQYKMPVQPTQQVQEYSHIPQSVSQPLLKAGSTTVSAEDLLTMVDGFMEKIAGAEEEITAKFKNKILHLEQSLKTKEVEIESLRQKLEDVELLVNIMEKKQV